MPIVARGLLSRSDWPVIKQQDAVVVLHYRLYSLVILHPPPEIFLGPTLLAVIYRLDRNIDNGYTDANIFFFHPFAAIASCAPTLQMRDPKHCTDYPPHL